MNSRIWIGRFSNKKITLIFVKKSSFRVISPYHVFVRWFWTHAEARKACRSPADANSRQLILNVGISLSSFSNTFDSSVEASYKFSTPIAIFSNSLIGILKCFMNLSLCWFFWNWTIYYADCFSNSTLFNSILIFLNRIDANNALAIWFFKKNTSKICEYLKFVWQKQLRVLFAKKFEQSQFDLAERPTRTNSWSDSQLIYQTQYCCTNVTVHFSHVFDSRGNIIRLNSYW